MDESPASSTPVGADTNLATNNSARRQHPLTETNTLSERIFDSSNAFQNNLDWLSTCRPYASQGHQQLQGHITIGRLKTHSVAGAWDNTQRRCCRLCPLFSCFAQRYETRVGPSGASHQQRMCKPYLDPPRCLRIFHHPHRNSILSIPSAKVAAAAATAATETVLAPSTIRW